MKNATFELKSGEPWIWKHYTERDHICCDCGLTHLVQVKIKKKEAIAKWFRDDFKTNINRKKLKIKISKK